MLKRRFLFAFALALCLPAACKEQKSNANSFSNSSYAVSSSSCIEAVSAVASSSSCAGGAARNILTDSRDCKRYKVVSIGRQTWMAENLNYNAKGSKCYGDNSGGDCQGNCARYGRLYDWATATAVCPPGWRLPDNADWDELKYYISPDANVRYNSVGEHLKAREGWTDCGPSGSGKQHKCFDTYGFAALPGGGGKSDGNFGKASNYGDAGNSGFWWSANKKDGYGFYGRFMRHNDEHINWNYNSENSMISVRCIREKPKKRKLKDG